MYHICVCIIIYCILSFPRGSAGKESACYVGDLGSIPGLGRFLGEGKGYTLQYAGLENSMNCIVHGVTKSQTERLSLSFSLSRFSCVWLFATPWTVAHRLPLSMGFSRQEYWSGLPCPPPGDLPNPGIKSLVSPVLAGVFFTISDTWEAPGLSLYWI